ncbi:MAG TPA: hypothetical protein VNB22_19535, partial [Pyrinomonadaceae bacterium]|nr:hypothetical protein [Pyrinomonadaceae bacterium]
MSEQTASAKAKAETSKRKSSGTLKKTSPTTEASLNMQELRELAELVNEHGFTDFEFENENIRIRLSKTAPAQFVQAVQPVASSASAAAPQTSAAPTAATAETVTAEVPTDSDADLFKITSPIVGTFYRSPSPDKDPYVQEGDKVSDSTVVCIVE